MSLLCILTPHILIFDLGHLTVEFVYTISNAASLDRG